MSLGTVVEVSSLKFIPTPGTWVVAARLGSGDKKQPLFQKLAPDREIKLGDPVCGCDYDQVIGGCASGYFNEVTHIITDKSQIQLLESLLQLSRANQERDGQDRRDDEDGCMWHAFQALTETLVKDYREISDEVKSFSGVV